MSDQRQPTPGILDDVLGPAVQTTMVAMRQIRLDGGTQMRAKLDEQTLTEYGEEFQDISAWGDFPPVVLL
ncbi:MAG: hypothetical protein IPM06_19940 [Rhizobiales bacterium]|nr:hypothetical protein [Hyphomicrobiales bacterium]